MFLPREKKILQMLLKSEKKFTTSQIAAELKVTPRTIKADIKKINDVLGKKSCRIQTQQGIGIWLDCDEQGKRYIKSALYEESDSYISADIRKYHIAAELLMHNREYTSMENIANRLYVSKATVVTDLNELEDFWKKFRIIFIKKVKYGICAKGSEQQIRLALADALKKAARGTDGLSLDKMQSMVPSVDLNGLKKVIRATENRYHFVLTEVSFNELLVQMAVMLGRLADNCRMTTQEITVENSPVRTEQFVTHFLQEQIGEILHVEVPDEEIVYLLTCLQGLRYHVPMVREHNVQKIRDRGPEMFDYMMEVISRIDKNWHLNLAEDEELACALFSHLECMIHRIQCNVYLENPILESVKKEMFYEYEIASYLISKFSARYNIEATENEIGYIAFHIGAAIERMRQNKKKNLVVTLICMTGIGTTQFISVKLKRLFPELEIRKIIPKNQAQELKAEEQNLVISTVPIYLEHLDVLQISPVLNEADIERIQKYIQNHMGNQEQKNRYSHLKQLLHSEISILNCDLKSKEEIIHLLGGRMMREGYVDENFVDSVFAREKISETAVGGLIAIPHAFEGYIKKQGIGLITLPKPISWGSEKVQVVFLLALSAKIENDFQGIFGDILDLSKNNKDMERVLRARKFSEIEIFKK